MLDLIDVGRRIADLRDRRGLTQEALARELHIPRTAVSRLENGQRDISYAEMLKLAEVLRVEMDELAQTDRYTEKMACYRQTKASQAVAGLEKANEIIEAMLGYEQLHRRFNLGGKTE